MLVACGQTLDQALGNASSCGATADLVLRFNHLVVKGSSPATQYAPHVTVLKAAAVPTGVPVRTVAREELEDAPLPVTRRLRQIHAGFYESPVILP